MDNRDLQDIGLDIDTPNVARVYDYYLGGACNLESDRRFASEILASFPEARDFALHNRRYQHRAVRYVSQLGVRQFLDLGSGIPTVGPTHEIARGINPDARVAYVDIESVAIQHSKLLLDGDEHAAILQADLREPETVLEAPEIRSVLDYSQPVAVMILAMLHFLSDTEDPAAIIARYLDALAPGSYLIVSHATTEGPVGDRVAAAAEQYAETTLPGHMRSREQFAAMLRPVEIIEPGIVWTPQWRPEAPEQAVNPERSVAYAAVGVKR